MTGRAAGGRVRAGAGVEQPVGESAPTARPEAVFASGFGGPEVIPAGIQRLQRAAGNEAARAVLQRAMAGSSERARPPTPAPTGRLARAASALASVTAVARPQLIQRTLYKFKKGGWVQKGPTTGRDRYRHPDEVTWKSKPKDGDTYDRETGKITRGGDKEHLLDYAAGDRKDYGEWYLTPKKKGKQKRDGRRKTAYSYLSGREGGSEQGPHTFAFIGKRAAAEASARAHRGIDPRRIKRRSALIPSPGQNRRLVRQHEENAATPIDKGRKRKLDEVYSGLFGLVEANLAETDPKRAKRDATRAKQAVVDLIELSALGTYALGRTATDVELAGKSENRADAVEDLKLLAGLDKGAALPAGLTVFDPHVVGHDPKHMAQYGRALGVLARGDEENLSDLDISSDEEYSEDEKPPDVDTPDEEEDEDESMIVTS